MQAQHKYKCRIRIRTQYKIANRLSNKTFIILTEKQPEQHPKTQDNWHLNNFKNDFRTQEYQQTRYLKILQREQNKTIISHIICLVQHIACEVQNK